MVPARADVTGSVVVVKVAAGDAVEQDQEIIVLECMKMEIPVLAPVSGTIERVDIAPHDSVKERQILATIREQG
ncbi:acetyl-CoA carboxylase biotin carboxyl carrier protein subunit [Pseudonocardia sp. RS11V-5]|uniref:acetyl-CoA carboxylase biotin carboxyl carrier protein subunit n=1 Tax=Pseudonocardia terrae TaxID=2905831 RepID=UPI001E447FE0|nr:acetyl-CoA carboxylase biotin carboxyl carrier protein subunit [Pseudonocardia terrae]MCE3551396.1 acetyl-CoA carboxylase biotin carboxyl carrier protein subunit [Pseudonocardia terrae]